VAIILFAEECRNEGAYVESPYSANNVSLSMDIFICANLVQYN